MNTPQGWLISYDITDRRRLQRLHRFLSKHATPVQYSVFHYEGSPAQMGQLMQSIETLIDPRSDDVRGYALPAHLSVDTLGRGKTSPDVLIHSVHSPQLQALLGPAKKC